MAACSSPVDPTESIDTELGIQPFHAYSILDLKQIGTERYMVHNMYNQSSFIFNVKNFIIHIQYACI